MPTNLPRDGNAAPIDVLRPHSTLDQTVSIGASPQQSALFNADTIVIRVVATQDCHVAFGLNPTASSSNMFLPGAVIEYFKVKPLDKISVIQNSTAGTLHITEMG